MSKLRFSVCYCSGEEPEYPADELNVHSPHTRGWQSPQFCDYPQELGLAWEAPARVTQVQILSHQSKIATQIELFVGHGDTYESAQFRRLGYLSLNSNERSKYQARELKSVYVNAPGQYLRMLVHKCYINEVNLFNQVGIVAVNLLGDKLGKLAPGALDAPPAPFGAGPRVVPGYAPERGGRAIGAGRVGRNEMNDLSFDMNFDPETAQRIRNIAAAKDKAVRSEDYDSAKLLKEAETQLKSLGQQLAQLEVAKREAVEDEDYDRAKMLKVEADALRLQISAHPNPQLRGILATASLQDVGGGHNSARVAGMHEGGSTGGGKRVLNSPRQMLPVEERPIAPRGHNRGRAGRSPEGASGGASGEYRVGGFGAGNPRESPPKLKPRMLHSGEGLRPDARPRSRGYEAEGVRESWEQEVDDGDDDGKGIEENEAGAFPLGEHPMEGVANFADLPPPESLSAKVDLSEVQGLTSLFGDYLTRCLYSKTWSLREAAILKIKLLLPSLEDDPGINNAIAEICQVLRVGCEDKIAQVFLTTLDLLDATLGSIASCKDTRHNHVVAALEPTVVTLLHKLGDGQTRLRDGAMNGLVAVARCRTAGPIFVSHVALKPVVKKQLSAWRPITARLNLLRQLVNEFGLESSSGLTTDSIMSFVQSCNGFAHSNGDVRDAARELTVELHALVGEEIEPYLTGLRPKQLDEYHDAFRHSSDKAGGRGTSRGSASRTTPRRATGHNRATSREKDPPAASSTPHTSDGENIISPPAGGRGRSHSPTKRKDGITLSRSPTLSLRTRVRDEVEEDDDIEDDVSCKCQFCGKYDSSFTDETLDMHYWQNCPMLMSCDECGQVIEISSIPEHLLDECQNRESYTECEISLLAIRTDDLAKWQKSKLCKPPGKGGPHSTCPLCFADVGSIDDEEMWREHLIEACPKNPRRA